MPFTIEFQPLGLRLRSENSINALDAVRQAGINLSAVCGGEGTCGKCVIQINSDSDTYPPCDVDKKHLSAEQLSSGYRLACMTTLNKDSKIYIPASSILEDQIIQTEGIAVIQETKPAVLQTTVSLEKANLKDLVSDFSRIKERLENKNLTAEIDILRKIPPILRENNWSINIWIRGDQVVHAAKESSGAPLGLAIDVGSTKIACYLIDLSTGITLTAKGTPNPQIAFGEDIMARLSYVMQGKENAKNLHQLMINAINDTTASMCKRIGRKTGEIVDICLVGNTAMHHFYLDLPTAALAVSPFIPAVTDPLYPPAYKLGLDAMPGAAVYAPPVKAGFIGSDHISFLFAAQFGKDERIRLGIDIGTNTEIALQANGHIVCVSTASGPAFEGAHIKFGMRAAPGAIEHIWINEKGETKIEVIGKQEPIGICGSGILDAVAQLRLRGILNKRGRLDKGKECVKLDKSGKPVFHLSHEPAPVSISQTDIDQILLAKGAIRAGIDILMDYLQINAADIEEIVIAGAFGSSMLPEHAMGIGMLPAVPLEHVKMIGNAAGTGACLMLANIDSRQEAEELAKQIEYLELTIYPEFPIFYAKGIQA